MKIPSNYTEQEVVETINGIADRLCYKFKFGYHSADDMKQQARMYGWQGLEKYDGERPLENFLWTHVRNRLYNFKRNNYARLEKPCDTCEFFIQQQCTAFSDQEECVLYKGWLDRNTAKKNLMYTVSSDLEKRHSDKSILGTVATKELMDILDQDLHVSFREDWIRLLNDLKLPKTRKDLLFEAILEILKEKGIDTEGDEYGS
jgi:hypothetical protein